ncbi:meiotic spindle pole body protein Kms1 [Sarracenia purpurea var. burkii]
MEWRKVMGWNIRLRSTEIGDGLGRLRLRLTRLGAKHQQELENLTLTTQPFRTLKFFTLAAIKYLKRSLSYLLAHGGWPMVLCNVVALIAILLFTIDGPHGKHIEELRQYSQFGLWWVALGVASSIGLGYLQKLKYMIMRRMTGQYIL